MKKILAALGIIAVIIVVGSYALHKADNTKVGMQDEGKVYTNETYGFSFEVPVGFEYNQYTDSISSVGHKTEAGFDSEADIGVIQSGGEGGYQSYDAFLFESTKNMCAADGPRETIFCNKIIEQQPFEVESGLSGTVFYQNRVTKNLETGEEEIDAFGPIFAFNIQANTPESKFSALIVRAPSNLPSGEVDSDLIRQIAQSIQIEKIEQR